MIQQMIALNKLSVFIRNGTSIKQQDGAGGDPITRIETIANKEVNLEKCGYADVSCDNYEKYLLQKGDILISHINSTKHLGKCAIFTSDNKNVIHGMNLLCLRVDEKKAFPQYVFHMLSSPSFLQQLPKITKNSVNQSSFNVTSFNDLQIPLPPLEIQKQIAAVLEKADQLRKDCLQMEQELNSLAQSVFIEMFGDVKEHEALEQHIEFITSGSRGWAKYYSNKGPRFIRSLDVQMNYIGDKDKAFVTPPEGKESERTKVEAGDVLLTITGSRIGRVSWIPPEFGDAHISQHVALIRLKDTLLPEFLSFYMSLDGFGQRQIAKSQYGQTKPGLKLDHIRAFFVPKLKRAEQQEFVNYMRKLASVTLHNKKQYQALNANFNALMQKAFNGELNLDNAKPNKM
ncbi:restriction endonuclease subunit S [Shewanella sp. AC34-MNA-CIBAN-0136]|uniref:restriction endonuclease subunit S n=1 Tax=Shewanella sp. AC34-MNA-CIBAN-0136 TaxID=3140463 RepID=UPI00332435E9